ncbi:MAG: DUF4390 domain-containing protein [Pseudomonadota bacterium]
MWLMALCLCASVAPAQPPATVTEPREPENFVVRHAETTLVNGVYLLDAEIDYRFNPDVLEALENGVPLILELQIEIIHPREWLWDEEFTTLQQRYRFQYHALTQQYLVKNLNSGIQYNYPARDAAIRALGTVSGLPILDKRLLEPEEPYTARLRARLDVESLPTPLRLLAYVSPQWQLVSDWYEWSLQH